MKKIWKLGLLLLFVLNLGVIVKFWFSSSMNHVSNASDVVLGFGRLAGLLAVCFVLLQFLLMGRAVWVERAFGLDKLANLHRLNGYLSIFFIILHPILLTVAYAMSSGVNVASQFIDFLLHYDDAAKAALAVLLFVLIVFFSIYIVRKKLRYETWYFIHLFTYLAVLLAFGHQLKLGGDFLNNTWFIDYWYFLYVFVFGNILIFRFAKPFYMLLRHAFAVSEVSPETDDVTSVSIKGKSLEKFSIRPGQFMILRFLEKGFWSQAHPFSLSCCPNGKSLRVSIKKLGDFTSKIPSLKPGTPVLIDGPFGGFTADYKQPTKFLFIAGGIGITPIRSLIETLAPDHDVILLYSNKNSSTIAFKKELDELAIKYAFPLYYVISNEPGFSGEKGRIDEEKLTRLVKDLKERQVYLCGPVPMMQALEKQLRDLGLQKSQIHYEKFSF